MHHRTSAQAEASRLNGRRSIGPTTDAGKARSSRNSRTHGLTSRRLTLDDESEHEWEEIFAAEVEIRRPVGVLETASVRRIAEVDLRLLRCGAIEASALRSAVVRRRKTGSSEENDLGDAFVELDAHNFVTKRFPRYERALVRLRRDEIKDLENLQVLRARAESAIERSRDRTPEMPHADSSSGPEELRNEPERD